MEGGNDNDLRHLFHQMRSEDAKGTPSFSRLLADAKAAPSRRDAMGWNGWLAFGGCTAVFAAVAWLVLSPIPGREAARYADAVRVPELAKPALQTAAAPSADSMFHWEATSDELLTGDGVSKMAAEVNAATDLLLADATENASEQTN